VQCEDYNVWGQTSYCKKSVEIGATHKDLRHYDLFLTIATFLRTILLNIVSTSLMDVSNGILYMNMHNCTHL
jgi:hypothetical protein